ncbi:MAG: hypothetical protein HY696_02755 [Deltaproteobacteria bacterium]|nr:hypothetical protein [Deltaproteobacteria bacterium]
MALRLFASLLERASLWSHDGLTRAPNFRIYRYRRVGLVNGQYHPNLVLMQGPGQYEACCGIEYHLYAQGPTHRERRLIATVGVVREARGLAIVKLQGGKGTGRGRFTYSDGKNGRPYPDATAWLGMDPRLWLARQIVRQERHHNPSVPVRWRRGIAQPFLFHFHDPHAAALPPAADPLEIVLPIRHPDDPQRQSIWEAMQTVDDLRLGPALLRRREDQITAQIRTVRLSPAERITLQAELRQVERTLHTIEFYDQAAELLGFEPEPETAYSALPTTPSGYESLHIARSTDLAAPHEPTDWLPPTATDAAAALTRHLVTAVTQRTSLGQAILAAYGNQWFAFCRAVTPALTARVGTALLWPWLGDDLLQAVCRYYGTRTRIAIHTIAELATTMVQGKSLLETLGRDLLVALVARQWTAMPRGLKREPLDPLIQRTEWIQQLAAPVGNEGSLVEWLAPESIESLLLSGDFPIIAILHDLAPFRVGGQSFLDWASAEDGEHSLFQFIHNPSWREKLRDVLLPGLREGLITDELLATITPAQLCEGLSYTTTPSQLVHKIERDKPLFLKRSGQIAG